MSKAPRKPLKSKASRSARNLPVFRYYRDPFKTGAFEKCKGTCDCCGRVRGYRYQGFLYAEEEIETICPWCVADGTAARKFEGTFVDDFGLDECDEDAIAELTERTPEFFSFQTARWLVHCGEPAVYIGVAGYNELKRHGEGTIQSVKDALPKNMKDAKKLEFVKSLSKDGSCVAHVFECLKCKAVVAYGECD